MEDYIGMIRMFGGNFAPRNYTPCDGRLLPIAQFSALFSILGTTYGGDGHTTFALPDFRGRVPLSSGHGPGLSNYTLGEKSGTEDVTLTKNQMPAHHHLGRIAIQSDTGKANGSYWAENSGEQTSWGLEAGGNYVNQNAITSEGGSQSHTNIQPYQCVYFVICVYGIFPPHQAFEKDGTPVDKAEEESSS